MFVVLLLGCTSEDPTMTVANWGNEKVETPVEPIVEYQTKEYHVTYTTVSTDSSYWYVILKGQETNWHGTVELPTPYFDFVEGMNQFSKVVKPCFFKLIVPISKESVPTYKKYTEKNYEGQE